MTLRTFDSKDNLESHINKNLTEDEKKFLESKNVNTYYQNLINNIWEEQCLEKIKQKINEYHCNNIVVSSRDDLEIQVRDQFNNVNSNLFNNNQIINAFNRTWNKIKTKKSRIKEKIDIKIREILLYNNDSINSQDNLQSKIKDEFNYADRTLIENTIGINLTKKEKQK